MAADTLEMRLCLIKAKIEATNAILLEQMAEVWSQVGRPAMAEKMDAYAAEGRATAGCLLAASADPVAAHAWFVVESAAVKTTARDPPVAMQHRPRPAYTLMDDATFCRKRAILALSAARTWNTSAGICEIEGRCDKAAVLRQAANSNQMKAEDWLAAANDSVTAAQARADYAAATQAAD
jgi:hypothetical protein